MVPANEALHYPTRILCATDFTPSSRRALEYAIALARPVGAEITLLHVLLLPLPSIDTDDEPDWMPAGPGERSELLTQMRHFAAPVEAAGLRTRILLRQGIPADEILHAAAQLEPDVIVMGSHGRRGLQRLLGSHAARVLRRAPCPVLTVALGEDAPSAEVPVHIREVLCAVSGSERAPRTAEYARCLAEGARARLTRLRVKRGDASSEILRLAKKRGADLIVIGNHDRGIGAVGYLGSTSDRVARHAGCGVLTVKAKVRPLKRTSHERALAGTNTRE